MKYIELKNSIQKGEAPARVYVVYGSDDYVRAEACRLLATLAGDELPEMNVAYVQDSDGIDAFIEALETYPMLADRKVVFFTISNKFSESDAERLKAYLADPPALSVPVIKCDAAFAKSFKVKGAVAVDCSELSDEEIALEIQPVLDEQPIAVIKNDALTELITRTKRNMSRIISELRKLKAYSQGVITSDDVRQMVVADLEYQIYKLTEAVANKNASSALQILVNLMQNGVKPKTVVDNLYERFRRLLHVSLNKSAPNEHFAKLFGVSAGAVYYLKRDAEAFTQVQLKGIVDYLHGLQCDILNGKRNDESAMHEAVLTLLSQ